MTQMEHRVTFTKEEIQSRVKVPAIVEVELKHLVEERLVQGGLYHRLFSRIKTAESLELKYKNKAYNEEKKIQDLVGLRIDLYFEDDLKICREILKSMFSLVEWSESEQNDMEFKPVKINGVFLLPEYLRRQISEETWEMCIDQTMEIQLKTMFFEGWHEIEHDMKYKGGELWEGRNNFSRYFNSILATLELCDKTLVSLFENLGHDLYKEKNWMGMMKAHFRLKMEERPLYPEVEEILDQDEGENNIGKRLYKTPRKVLVEELLRQPRPVPINVNTIIALLNEAVIHDERLSKIFHEKDVFDDGESGVRDEISYRRPQPLRRVTVFHALVNLSTYKYSAHEGCVYAAKLAYSWLYDKFGQLDRPLPDEPTTFQSHQPGYHIQMDYEPWREWWRMSCEYIDLESPGQVWMTEAECYQVEDGRQMLSVKNSYAVVGEARESLNRYFSCPKFYSVISDRIGLFDVRYLSASRRIIEPGQVEKVRNLIISHRRTMPVCLIVSREQENGWLDEEWLENFRVHDFVRMAGRYVHIYTCSVETAWSILEPLGIIAGDHAVYLFKAARNLPERDILRRYVVYNPEDIHNCTFGRHQVKNETNRYDIVTGGQAFYHKLLQTVRLEIMKD